MSVRRVIAARPERLFEAWTNASQLQAWWGPAGVRCPLAEVDARVGGRYRIDNQMADGSVVSIRGEFLALEPPSKRVYTWVIGPPGSEAKAAPERVTVQFEPRDQGTEVIVTHERIAGERTRAGHEAGWIGCLGGLERYVATA